MQWAAVALLLASAAANDLEPLPVPSDHSPAVSWADVGWNGFRWGMGLGDVLAVLTSEAGSFRIVEGFGCDASEGEEGAERSFDTIDLATCWVEPTSHRFLIVGERPRIAFTFWKRRLSDVSLYLGGSNWFEEHRDKHVMLLGALREKYGRDPQIFPGGFTFPERLPDTPVIAFFDWSQPRLSIRLTSYTGRKANTVRVGDLSITYTDPAAASDLNRNARHRRFQQESKKL